MTDLSNENVVHVRNGGIEYLQFKRLLEYKKLVHCFTLKPITFGDNKNFFTIEEMVKDNYKNICDCLQLDSSNVVRPFQTHTNNVKSIDSENGIFIKKLDNIDGLITDKKNKVLSLTFADCTPIMLFDPIKNVIGNIHSGWKGTLNKIGEIAVEKMKKDYGCSAENIICCIGPTIRKCHFEVDEDVKKMFYDNFVNTGKINDIIEKGEIKDKKQKYMIDTVFINKLLMKNAGLKEENIIDSNICTVCNSECLHSYRKEGNEAGRSTLIMSLI